MIYLSHITSPTALILPVAAICARARAAGILTVIDGAHAPGQIAPGSCRRSMPTSTRATCTSGCAPPRAQAFCGCARRCSRCIEPLVVSWGYGPERSQYLENDFVSALQWQGTDDPTSYPERTCRHRLSGRARLAARSALRCQALLAETLERIAAITGLPPAYPAWDRLVRPDGNRPDPRAGGPAALQGAAVGEVPDRDPRASTGRGSTSCASRCRRTRRRGSGYAGDVQRDLA